MVYKYIIDSSSWINMKRWYPTDNFPTLWDKVEELIRNGLITIPVQVYNEINQGNDELKKLFIKFRSNYSNFVVDKNNSYYTPMIKETQRIIQKSNNMKWLKPKPDIADPYVIALAYVLKTSSISGYTHDVIVVQDNTKEMNNICKLYKINTCRTIDLIKHEKWKF